MKKVILLRYGEIHLKGHNRGFFERLLFKNIKEKLSKIDCKIGRISGRYLVWGFDQSNENTIIQKLQQVFGLVSVSSAFEISAEQEEVQIALLEYFNKLEMENGLVGKTFKIEVKRADKKFPIKSDEYAAILGETVLKKYPNLKVKLKKPDLTVYVEIRENGKAYIHSDKTFSVGGMPVGSSGKGLLMLSGGIDSPVAGYMMAKRGLSIDAIHFHSFPYTSIQAKEKVISLAEVLTQYIGDVKIYLIPFTRIQELIHANCDDSYMITIMRRIMLRIAEKVCELNGIKTIITGESLGQVASQTIESITVTNSVLKKIPVMRPLIGMDKSEITEISKKINTFDISILPYEDCCTVFLPKNPVIKPTIEKAENEESFLDIDTLVDAAVEAMEIIEIKA